MRIFVILTKRHYRSVRSFVRSKMFTNRQKCESFYHFRTRSIYSGRGFTVEMGYIDLVTVVCVNVLVALNTATNSMTNGRVTGSSEILLCCKVSVQLLVSYLIYSTKWAGLAQTVQRLATVWEVGRSKTGAGEIFCTRRDGPRGPPRLLYNGYRFFPESKRHGNIINYLHHLGTNVKKVQSYTSTNPLGLRRLLQY